MKMPLIDIQKSIQIHTFCTAHPQNQGRQLPNHSSSR